MYEFLLLSHSYLRYAVLVLLLAVLAKSLMGWLQAQPYGKADNGLSLGLFISTHLQLTLGLALYFVSPVVQFTEGFMKEKTLRYWAVEHVTMMIIAIVLITLARITVKKMTSNTERETILDEALLDTRIGAPAKHRRLFIFNFLALILIVGAIFMSGRPFIG